MVGEPWRLQPPSLKVASPAAGLMPQRTPRSRTRVPCFVLSMASVSPFFPAPLLKHSGSAGRGSPRCAGWDLYLQTTGTRCGKATCANHRQPSGSGMVLGTWPCRSGVSHSPTALVMQRLARAVMWGRGVGPWCRVGAAWAHQGGWQVQSREGRRGKLRQQWGVPPSPAAPVGLFLSSPGARGCVGTGGGQLGRV